MDLYSKLGLTKYEMEVYLAVLKHGRVNASQVSEISEVPITASYPALKQLINKGLIQKFEGNPSLFESISPEKAINRLVDKKKKELEEIKKELIRSYKEDEHKGLPIKKKVLELGVGREFSSDIYYETFKQAKKSIYILGWRFEKIGDKYTILNKLKSAIKRGVDIKIILIGDRNNKQRELIRDYIDEGIKIRFLPLEDISILIGDSNNCKITIKRRGEEKVNINILDKNLAEVMKMYYSNLWESAESI